MRALLMKHGLVVSGVDAEGRTRVVELADHPFFLGTLIVSQVRSRPDAPHPLIVGFIEAARAHAVGDAR